MANDQITPEQRSAIQQEALTRAVSGQTVSNYPAIFEGFMEKGIPEADIRPRENIFTFNAWKALGRSVKKGEHGVKVVTWITAKGREQAPAGVQVESFDGVEHALDSAAKGYRMCKTTTVFHVSQTEVKN